MTHFLFRLRSKKNLNQALRRRAANTVIERPDSPVEESHLRAIENIIVKRLMQEERELRHVPGALAQDTLLRMTQESLKGRIGNKREICARTES